MIDSVEYDSEDDGEVDFSSKYNQPSNFQPQLSSSPRLPDHFNNQPQHYTIPNKKIHYPSEHSLSLEGYVPSRLVRNRVHHSNEQHSESDCWPSVGLRHTYANKGIKI